MAQSGARARMGFHLFNPDGAPVDGRANVSADAGGAGPRDAGTRAINCNRRRPHASAIGTSLTLWPCSSTMATNQPDQLKPGMNRAMGEALSQCHGICASGGIAGKVDAFVIVQDAFAIGEMEEITRHNGLSAAGVCGR